ncbi:MAG TPA: hypothetical protein VFW87_07820 [Pirellulales bacterium]|nr:hypothetical protein [Pirellulales bacterium]
MIAHDRWLRNAALLVVVAMPTALGACCLAEGDWYRWLAVYLLQGPLVLIALWSALSNTPVYIRWPCGYLVLWAACPLLGPAFAVHAYFWVLGPDFAAHAWPHDGWRLLLAWQIVPHVLLTFTLLCLLRELDLGIQRPMEGPEPTIYESRWRFTLRKVFGWTAGAAVLSLLWKKLLVAIPGELHPLLLLQPDFPWELVANGMFGGISLALIDLLAVWALLRPGRVRWRFVLLAIIVAITLTPLWHYALRMTLGLSLHQEFLDSDISQVRAYDVYCLGPMMLALFLVRLGGYRWTASRSLSP